MQISINKKPSSLVKKIIKIFTIISLIAGVSIGLIISYMFYFENIDLENIKINGELLSDYVIIEEDGLVKRHPEGFMYVEFDYKGNLIQTENAFLLEENSPGEKALVFIDKESPETSNFALPNENINILAVILGVVCFFYIFILLIQFFFPFLFIFGIIDVIRRNETIRQQLGNVKNSSVELEEKKAQVIHIAKNNKVEEHYSSNKYSQVVDKDECVSCDKEDNWSKGFFKRKDEDSFNDVEDFYKSRNINKK